MRPFGDVVRDLAGGETYDELTAALAEVVAAVMETRKAGEITLKLSVRANGENSVRIVDDVKIKVPKLGRGESVFFATADGSLIRNDPRQLVMPLREVDKPEAKPLKEAALA